MSLKQAAMQPVILSMDVDDDDACESEYRVRIGDQVKYLIIRPGTFDRDTLSMPLSSLQTLPYDAVWTVADVSRNEATGQLEYSLSDHALASIECKWHQTTVDCLELERVKQLTACAFEATIARPSLPTTVIAKIARFEWEIPRLEQETRAYQLLEGLEMAPRFLAHVHEGGRIIGFLLEKLEGRPAHIGDLDACRAALGVLHGKQLLHGDVNRYNFLITEQGVKLLDFECFEEDASPEAMEEELNKLAEEFVEESGRGAGFMPVGD